MNAAEWRARAFLRVAALLAEEGYSGAMHSSGDGRVSTEVPIDVLRRCAAVLEDEGICSCQHPALYLEIAANSARHLHPVQGVDDRANFHRALL